MRRVPPVKVDDVDKWMEINTFVCRFGRVTPEECERLRARPTMKEWIKEGGKGENPKIKPSACEECYEWQLLCQMVYEKRKKFYEKLKKQEKEGREMAEKRGKNTKAKKGPIVQVNFAKYPELYQKLKEMAKEECRELHQQIIFCVKRYLKVMGEIKGILEEKDSEKTKTLEAEN